MRIFPFAPTLESTKTPISHNRLRRAMAYLPHCIVSLAIVGGMVLVPQQLAWSVPETRMAQALDVAPGTTVRVAFPVTHAFVQWDGDGAANLELRGQTGDIWSSWKPVLAEESDAQPAQGAATANVNRSAALLMNDARALQVRVVSGNVSDVRVWALDTKHGPRHVVAKSATPSASALYGQTPAPRIVTRSQWGANESLRRDEPSFAPINRIVIHHTASPNDDPDPAATVRGIYQFHVLGNGWDDIGYNFIIDRSGNIYEGRYARQYDTGEVHNGEDQLGQGVVGAHAMNANYGSVGISLIGTYDAVPPTTAQQDALKRVIAWKGDLHNLNVEDPNVVVGHRDVYQTSCPGDVGYSLLPRWRSGAKAIVTANDIPRVIPGNVPGNIPGYWITNTSGFVSRFGAAQDFGSMAGKPLAQPITGMMRTPSASGYWLLGRDGGIFSFGDAQFYGSMGGKPLNKPVVDLTPTPSGRGYWLVASDGGIFAFGDAQFYGSMGGKALNKPVVGIASTPTGLGYWLVASDGGIFAFGDAQFYGSMGGKALNRPVSGMTRPANSSGYWLFAEDGGVFTFGNIAFYGSVPSMGLSGYAGTAQALVTPSSHGYYVLSRAGAVYSFGDARYLGAGVPTGAAVGMAIVAP